MTRCLERERDNNGTGNREKLLATLDLATARMIRLVVANARPDAGTIVFLTQTMVKLSGTLTIRTRPWPLALVSAKTGNFENVRAMTRCAKEYRVYM